LPCASELSILTPRPKFQTRRKVYESLRKFIGSFQLKVYCSVTWACRDTIKSLPPRAAERVRPPRVDVRTKLGVPLKRDKVACLSRCATKNSSLTEASPPLETGTAQPEMLRLRALPACLRRSTLGRPAQEVAGATALCSCSPCDSSRKRASGARRRPRTPTFCRCASFRALSCPAKLRRRRRLLMTA